MFIAEEACFTVPRVYYKNNPKAGALPPAFGGGYSLFAQAKLCNKCAVALDIFLLQVGKQVAALANHH